MAPAVATTADIAAIWADTTYTNGELAKKAGTDFNKLYNRIRKSAFWASLKGVGRTPSRDIYGTTAASPAAPVAPPVKAPKADKPKKDKKAKKAAKAAVDGKFAIAFKFTTSTQTNVYNENLQIEGDNCEEIFEVMKSLAEKYKINGYFRDTQTNRKITEATELVNGGSYQLMPIVKAG